MDRRNRARKSASSTASDISSFYYSSAAQISAQEFSTRSSSERDRSGECLESADVDSLMGTSGKHKSVNPVSLAPRRVVVMRHGERVDDLFPGWIHKSNASGKYQSYDLNLPLSLPNLNRPLSDYEADTVLTEMGCLLAQMVGGGLLFRDSVPDVVYVSPALRCVQTAHNALKAAGRERRVKIRVEPSLFETIDLKPKGLPKFATPKQLSSAGFNIELEYTPIKTVDEIWSGQESAEEYSDRIRKVLLELSEKPVLTAYPQGSIIMVVGHASTIDLALGLFRETIRKTRSVDLINNGLSYPFCATAVFDKSAQCWSYNEEALPPITYRNFTSRINREFALRTNID